MDKKHSHIPAPLEKLQKRFDQWRQTYGLRSRLPDELWTAAVKMAGVYGICQTARTLRVDYHSIKKRGEPRTPSTDNPPKPSAPKPAFVERRGVRFVELAALPPGPSPVCGRGKAQASPELMASPPSPPALLSQTREGSFTGSPETGGCEWIVEWEDAAGSKMRVHLKNATMPDLIALGRSFWSPAS